MSLLILDEFCPFRTVINMELTFYLRFYKCTHHLPGPKIKNTYLKINDVIYVLQSLVYCIQYCLHCRDNCLHYRDIAALTRITLMIGHD
jgi:hypothetical protein